MNETLNMLLRFGAGLWKPQYNWEEKSKSSRTLFVERNDRDMKMDMGAKLMVYPNPLFIVATYDAEGKANAMTVGWGGVCCSVPPCVSISVRKATHTYHALIERSAFTLNLPSQEHCDAVRYFGSASGKNDDKFAHTGLTPVKSGFVDAPYIDEMPVNLECRVIQTHEIGSHIQFIGEIINAKVSGDIDPADAPIIEQIKPIVYGVGDNNRYYALGKPVI